jgi:hypothetical protein
VWSNTSGAKTASVAGVPLAPSNVVVGNANRASLRVTWSNNTPPALTSNVIQRSNSGPNGPWTTAGTVGSTSTSYTLTGLRNNTTYWIRVNAVNAGGTTSSAVKTGTTLR